MCVKYIFKFFTKIPLAKTPNFILCDVQGIRITIFPAQQKLVGVG